MPVGVAAAVTPRCVTPPTKMTLDVMTKPGAAVVYQAVYSDGRGGSAPPYGRGYGGNDKGFASPDGRYSSTWVVAAEAPTGRARVDVYVAYRGKYGYAAPRFVVADRSGGC